MVKMTQNIDIPGENNLPSLMVMKNVTVIKGGRKILDSVSLSIGQGEHVAIIGPNGSGKSSLIKTFTKEYHPLAAADGLILNIMFFSSIGIYYNHKVTPEMEARAREVLKFLKISHLADRLMSELSSGEARRVLIGRALVHDPQALILDEPANSLDLKALQGFRESIRKIAGSGKSVILVTHNLEDIIPEIDRVILIKDGKIFMDGKKQEILTSSNLSELFSLPIEVIEKKGYYQALI